MLIPIKRNFEVEGEAKSGKLGNFQVEETYSMELSSKNSTLRL